jgi:hypothetical protein
MKISELTTEQEALLDDYKRKWRSIALSTQTIDRQKATKTIESIYGRLTNTEEYEIYFFDSPFAVTDLNFLHVIYPNENWCNSKKLNNLIRRVKNQLLRQLFSHNFDRDIVYPLIEVVGSQLDINLWHHLEKRLMFSSPLSGLIPLGMESREKSSSVWKSAKPNQQEQLKSLRFFLSSGLIAPDFKCSICCVLDYCISELECIPDKDRWELLKSYVTYCGWTFFFQDFCFTCSRPSKMIIDDNSDSHAIKQSFIQFSDDFKILVEHGYYITPKIKLQAEDNNFYLEK